LGVLIPERRFKFNKNEGRVGLEITPYDGKPFPGRLAIVYRPDQLKQKETLSGTEIIRNIKEQTAKKSGPRKDEKSAEGTADEKE
jgi:hypothetical protein